MSTLVWVSLSDSAFPSSSGPNELTVARSWTPSLPLRLTNSPGHPAGFQAQPMSLRAPVDAVAASPGMREAGEIALDVGGEDRHARAESCSVEQLERFVLPVPVAPAMSPCRFIIASGILIFGSWWTVAPLSSAAPSVTRGIGEAVAGGEHIGNEVMNALGVKE